MIISCNIGAFKLITLLMLSVAINASSSYADSNLSLLEANCSKKVKSIVYSTGATSEKMNGYCHGYLIATYDGLLISKKICPDTALVITPEHLWSIVTYYLLDPKEVKSDSAYMAVQNSLMRAFPCLH